MHLPKSSICRLAAFFVTAVMLESLTEAGYIREYCLFDSFNASCMRSTDVILMDKARYGRMQLDKCLKKQYDQIGCSSDVITFMDSHCSGRKSCHVSVTDIGKAGINPCTTELPQYLEAAFSCVKGEEASLQQCRQGGYYATTTSSGFISSELFPKSGSSFQSHSSYCPWKIEAPPGKRINLTLFDFSTYNTRSRAICRQYFTIKEHKHDSPKQICGGKERVKNIYLTEGTTAELTFQNVQFPQSEKGIFLVQYQFVGCPLFTLPQNTHMFREGDKWTIACNFTTQKWSIQCANNQWIGLIGNCTKETPVGIWQVLTEDWSSPYGILVVIGLGVALGVIIGIMLLVAVLAWLKRRRILLRGKTEFPAKELDPSEGSTSQSRTYQTTLSYDPERSTYSCTSHNAWISQRPLPQPAECKEQQLPGTLRRGVDGNPLTQSCTLGRRDRHFGNSQGYPANPPGGAAHIYESPTFSRKEMHAMSM